MAGALIRDPSWRKEDLERRDAARKGVVDLARNPGGFLQDDFAKTRESFAQGGLGRVVRDDLSRSRDIIQAGGASVAQGINTLFQGRESAAAGRAQADEAFYNPARSQQEAATPGMTADDVRIIDPPAPPTYSQDDVRGMTDRGTSRQSGLTRIVKTAPGVYTQVQGNAAVEGEERIYDAVGNRADRNSPAEDKAGLARNPLRDVQDYYAREQAGANLMDTEQGRREVVQRGQDSRALVGRMQEENGMRRNADLLRRMDPADRARLEAANVKERGLDERARLDREVRREGQQLTGRAALITSQGNQAQRAFENEDVTSNRLFSEDAATRDAEWTQLMAPLKTASKQERIDAFSDPNSPYAQALAAAESQLGASGNVKPDFNLGDLELSAWRSKVPGVRDYTDGRQNVGGGVDIDLLPQSIRDMLPEIQEARRQQTARNRSLAR